jgi:hypothetical protein
LGGEDLHQAVIGYVVSCSALSTCYAMSVVSCAAFLKH